VASRVESSIHERLRRVNSPGDAADRRYGLCVAGIGVLEIVLILLIVLLIFGGRRIPQLGRALGSGLRSLREHAGAGSSDNQVESGQGAPPPSSAEPVEDEEAARRP
jgi:sec-independent protein translocase protein TatA